MREAVKIAGVSDVQAGEAIVISRDLTGTEDDIAIVKTEDEQLYAIDNTCTHGMASLAEGWVEEQTIECPLHASAFCLRTGEPLTPPATEPVGTHALEIRGDEIWIFPGTPRPE